MMSHDFIIFNQTGMLHNNVKHGPRLMEDITDTLEIARNQFSASLLKNVVLIVLNTYMKM
jgi:hypothetical protein